MSRFVKGSSPSYLFFVIFFFFQAEDGIRDTSVTGVQTCALPISGTPSPSCWISRSRSASWTSRSKTTKQAFITWRRTPGPGHGGTRSPRSGGRRRSEERRVGKECRYRWRADKIKKNKQYRTKGNG